MPSRCSSKPLKTTSVADDGTRIGDQCQCGHARGMHFQQRHDYTARVDFEMYEKITTARILNTGRKCACVEFVKSRIKA